MGTYRFSWHETQIIYAMVAGILHNMAFGMCHVGCNGIICTIYLCDKYMFSWFLHRIIQYPHNTDTKLYTYNPDTHSYACIIIHYMS